MRMATFNILHGRSVHDGSRRPGPAGRRPSASSTPTCWRCRRSTCDQPRSAHGRPDRGRRRGDGRGRATGSSPRSPARPGATWMAATGREQPGTAAYGIALLSRYPAESWQVVRLPRIPVRFPMYLRRPAPRAGRARGAARGDGRAARHPARPADGRQHPPVVRARLEPRAAASADPRPARLSRPAGADGRPQHDAARRDAAGPDAAAGAAPTFPADEPERSSTTSSPTTTTLRADRLLCAGVADLGSSGACRRHFAAVTT